MATWLTYISHSFLVVFVVLASWVVLVLSYWIFGLVLLMASAIKDYMDQWSGWRDKK